jgi:hypothetical protein
MDHNFLAGFIAGGAIMIMLWLAGWLDWPNRVITAIIIKLIGEE